MAKKVVETPMMQQFYQIKQKHPDAILLFRVGDFYETFCEDAIDASEILGITLTRRANGSAQFVELAGFPHHALDTYLPKLVRAGRRVAICDQLEDPKLTKKLVKRGITELVTPGVVMGDNVLKHKENNYLAAVYLSSDFARAGLSLLDISTGEFLCSEGDLDHIDKLLESYQPKEVLVERKQKGEFARRFDWRGFVFDLDDWCFAELNNREKLLAHFGLQSLKGFGIDHLSYALSSSGAILNYLEMTSHHKIGHITTLRCIDRSSFVRLDAFTLRSLEILSPMNSDEGRSLLEVIDHTRTPMGGRSLRRWLTFPLIDVKAIEERQSVVEALASDVPLLQAIEQALSSISDVERLISKAAVGRIGPREVNQLQLSLRSLASIQEICQSSPAEVLHRFAEQIDPCLELCEVISQTLVPEPPLALGRGDTIAPGVDTELDELRSLASGGKDYLAQLQERESSRTGITSLKIAFNNVFGYYIEVRNAHKDKVPNDWIRKQTLVNAERYIMPELKEYEEKILGAEGHIAALEARLFAELVQRIGLHTQTIQRNAQLIASIDCLQSFASCAQRYEYTRPKVSDNLSIRIEAGRHPVIERQLPLGQPYIPNDVCLDTEQTQIMVITGPNMSGKSALLRQTALITLLAQIGSFVPARKAEIGVVDSIFTRVGASDNISRGESTFMVEMQEAAGILNNFTSRSLILFDELGRGTSTYDGISIAWAIVEYLHDNQHGRPKTLFATHYHELNELEGRLDRVKNYNVSAREIEGKMLFLRKLERGGSEHSFGIQVAKLGGMPLSVTDRASSILAQLEADHASVGQANPSEPKVKVKSKSRQELLHIDRPQNLHGVQMSFFQLDDPVLEQIREMLLKVEINHLTPLQALNKLSEIQSLLKMR